MTQRMMETAAIWRQIKITKDFRTYCAGRLFWRNKNPHWKIWHEADIALVINRDRTRQFFTRLEEIEVYIIDCLKYPDAGSTRDYEKPKRKLKRITTLRYLNLAPDEVSPVPVCPHCGQVDTIYNVRIDAENERGEEVILTYKKCSVCNTPENQELDNQYWTDWDDTTPDF